MSISYDKKTREFGSSDTLINAKDFGRSITYPRESPTKKFISFVGLDYGYFSIFNKESNIYFFNKETGEITMSGVNSEFTESYPSWSRNGSWLMFVSKRDEGQFSQVWFSHIDENGIAGKAFVMPQKEPDFYKDYLYNYNRPEFISGKVKRNPRIFFTYAKTKPVPSTFNEASSVSISSGATVTANPEDRAGDDEHYNHN